MFFQKGNKRGHHKFQCDVSDIPDTTIGQGMPWKAMSLSSCSRLKSSRSTSHEEQRRMLILGVDLGMNLVITSPTQTAQKLPKWGILTETNIYSYSIQVSLTWGILTQEFHTSYLYVQSDSVWMFTCDSTNQKRIFELLKSESYCLNSSFSIIPCERWEQEAWEETKQGISIPRQDLYRAHHVISAEIVMP